MIIFAILTFRWSVEGCGMWDLEIFLKTTCSPQCWLFDDFWSLDYNVGRYCVSVRLFQCRVPGHIVVSMSVSSTGHPRYHWTMIICSDRVRHKFLNLAGLWSHHREHYQTGLDNLSTTHTARAPQSEWWFFASLAGTRDIIGHRGALMSFIFTCFQTFIGFLCKCYDSKYSLPISYNNHRYWLD